MAVQVPSAPKHQPVAVEVVPISTVQVAEVVGMAATPDRAEILAEEVL
jgi:hypothetical protein